jgi:hypothetical protein
MTHPHPLIIWNEEDQKWSDPGNDFHCKEAYDGEAWVVDARYGFSPEATGPESHVFPTQTEAMAFFVNYLHERRLASKQRQLAQAITLAEELVGLAAQLRSA